MQKKIKHIGKYPVATDFNPLQLNIGICNTLKQ